MKPRAAAAVVGVAASAALFAETSARAQLRDEAERVVQAWRLTGADVAIARPRFVMGERTDLVLPSLPDAPCTTLALLGPRGIAFRAVLVDGNGDEAGRASSEAGAVSVERCEPPALDRVVVLTQSGRGALELVAARSNHALPALKSVLPERAAGDLGPEIDPGRLPALASPEKRAAAEEGRARREGAEIRARSTWMAGADGRGSEETTLDAGCHVLTLLGLDPGGGNVRGKLDVDAEMRDGADDRVMVRDQSDAPDALLAACVGEETRVNVGFVGASPETRVVVVHAFQRLPAHLPAVWGPETRARMAQALLGRSVGSLPGDAIFLAHGGSGPALVPLSLEPGACYLAVAALSDSANGGIGLSVRVGGRERQDPRTEDGTAAAVAFCAETRGHALAEVDARGAPLFGWAVALYRLESGVWDPPGW